MALTTIQLPRLGSNWQNDPSFTRKWNNAMAVIETTFNAILAIPEIQASLVNLNEATQAAADAANAANAAASAAQSAADTAQASSNATTAATSLVNSYVTPANVLSATDAGTSATISIASNNRVYGDGTSVSVGAGSVTSLAYSTLYYIYYSDPSRAGGSVAYQASTNQSDAAQVNDIHTVGSVTTPAAAAPPSTGNTVRPPGVGAIP